MVSLPSRRRADSVESVSWLLLLAIQIRFAACDDHFSCLPGTPPAAHFGLLPFQFLVDREEVLDLPAHVGKNLVHGVYLIVARIAIRDGQDFLVSLLVIHHVEDAQRTNFNHTAGEA